MDITATCAQLLSDDDITELYFERNEDALAATERKYGRLFLSIAAGITGSAEDAAECVNDAYMKLWKSIPPEKPRSLRAYGAKIVKNLSVNRAEYNCAERRGGGEIMAELDESVPDESASEIEERELSSTIDSFLRTLDRENRVVFVLRYWHCMSVENVAKRVGCSVSNVKSKLFRTRKKLKDYLEKEGVSL
ncbi:MAG: sigma-70 family RNA polymerase sigma factor [Clostridia bacterium]|nr:sigma-70 family RNA polymerase sigma factor [Clostridia bacterium]